MPNPVDNSTNSQTAIALRRLQLEAKVGEAIARAQKQYMQTQKKPIQAPTGNGPSHLGSKLDVRA